MRRRQFLAGGAALLPVALAGCGHVYQMLDLKPATDDRITDVFTMHVDTDSAEHAVVADALESGTTVRHNRDVRFESATLVQFEDRIYEVTATDLGDRDADLYTVRLDGQPENATANRGAIEYDELPAADRHRLDSVVSLENRSERAGTDTAVTYGIAADGANESVFVPEQRYDVFVHDSNRYRIVVDSRPATSAYSRYEVTAVARDIDAFAAERREEYRFELTDLSADEQDVVEEAIDGTYYDDSDAFRSIVERLRSHEPMRREADYEATWLLAYDGDEYVTDAMW